MGQKIIPISLRLNKNENWHSKWIVEKNEYSNILHFDLEIRKYFENIFNYKNFKLIKINITKTSKNINVYIFIHKLSKKCYTLYYNKIINYLNLYYKNNNIKLFIKNIKFKELIKLKINLGKILFLIRKKNKRNKKLKKIVFNFSYALYTKNINIISTYIKQNLEKKKNT